MKALTYHGSKDVRVEDVPDPTLVQADDIILRIGDADIRTLEDLQQVLVSAEPGTKAMVTLLRGGERKEIEVTFE